MASQRLTKTLKESIKSNIKAQVVKTMNESIPGMELQELKDTLVTFIRKTIGKLFTTEELVVLKKYNKTHKIRHLNIVWRFEAIGTTWNDIGVRLNFNPVMELPGTYDFNDDGCIKLVQKDPAMVKVALEAIKIHEHVDCEIKTTVDSFMEVVNCYTTTAKLLAENPTMEKYIPETDSPEKHIVSDKAKSIIKNFQVA